MTNAKIWKNLSYSKRIDILSDVADSLGHDKRDLRDYWKHEDEFKDSTAKKDWNQLSAWLKGMIASWFSAPWNKGVFSLEEFVEVKGVFLQ